MENPYLKEIQRQPIGTTNPYIEELGAPNPHRLEAEYRTNFQTEFDMDLMRKQNTKLVQFTLTETLGVKNFRRTKDVQLDTVTKDILQGQYASLNAAAFSVDNLVNQHSGILKYSPNAIITTIEGGWNEKRYSFECILETHDIGNSETPAETYRTHISGYTHMADVSLRGTLSPDTVFIVDEVLTTVNNVFQGAYNVLHNPNGSSSLSIDYDKMSIKDADAQLYSMRPVDISTQLATARYGTIESDNNESDGFKNTHPVDSLVTNIITARPVESNVLHNNPMHAFSETLQNISKAFVAAGDHDNPYDIHIRASIYSPEANLNRDPFFNWLGDQHFEKRGNFTLKDLQSFFADAHGIEPHQSHKYVDSIMQMIISGHNNASIFNANENNRNNILYTSAHLLIDALQPLLKRLFIREMFVSITNKTFDGSTIVTLEGENALVFDVAGINAMAAFNVIKVELEHKVFPMITQGKYAVGVSCLINKQGARVDIDIDGFGKDSIAFSMYSYSLMSPVIGTKFEQDVAVQNISALSKHIIGV